MKILILEPRPAVKEDGYTVDHTLPKVDTVIHEMNSDSKVVLAGFLHALADEINPPKSLNHR